jgi:hypothetical protein
MVTGRVLIGTKISKRGISSPDEMIIPRAQFAALLTVSDRRI